MGQYNKPNTHTGINFKPIVATTPSKPKPGNFGKPTSATTRDPHVDTLKQAVMGRSKLPVKKGTQATAIKD